MSRKHRPPSIKTSREPAIAEAVHYRKVSDEEVQFTQSLAAEFIDYESFVGERPVRDAHVQHLYDEFRRGQFVWHHVILAAALLWEKVPGGEAKKHIYRLNGQHTAWMRIYIPKDQEPKSCKVRRIIYSVENAEELRALYSIFDRNAPRTAGHVTKVLLIDSRATAGIAPSSIGFLTSGFKFWRWDSAYERSTRGTPSEVAALIQDRYSTLFNTVGQYAQGHMKDALFVKRSAVVAALFATFDKSPNDAHMFWDNVMTGLGLNEESDPRYQLRRFIETHGHNLKGEKDPVSQEELFRICVAAWNRWRKNEKVTILRPTDARAKILQ